MIHENNGLKIISLLLNSENEENIAAGTRLVGNLAQEDKIRAEIQLLDLKDALDTLQKQKTKFSSETQELLDAAFENVHLSGL
jgi:hypothetical protein